MRVNVVARGSLASSAAETRTGATAGCAWACSVSRLMAASAEPGRQDRSAGPPVLPGRPPSAAGGRSRTAGRPGRDRHHRPGRA